MLSVCVERLQQLGHVLVSVSIENHLECTCSVCSTEESLYRIFFSKQKDHYLFYFLFFRTILVYCGIAIGYYLYVS